MKCQVLLSLASAIATVTAGKKDRYTNETNNALKIGKKLKPMLNADTTILRRHETRTLRTIGQRRTKSGKVSSKDHTMNNIGHENILHHDSKSGKQSKSSKGGKSERMDSNDSKSGKSSKGGDNDDDYTPYYMAPFQCTNKCIDADGVDFRTGELNRAVTSCNTNPIHGDTQRWVLRQENDFIQVESYAYKGECISVNYMPRDNVETVTDKCHDGTLAMLPCHDPASKWYFTGGELLSFFCWQYGISSKMSPAYNAEKDKCHNELQASSSAMGMASTFMFIDSEDMYRMYDPSTVEYDPTSLPTISPSYNPTMFPTVMPTISNEPTADMPTYSPTPQVS